MTRGYLRQQENEYLSVAIEKANRMLSAFWFIKAAHDDAQALVVTLQVSSVTGLSPLLDQDGTVQLWIGTGREVQVFAGLDIKPRQGFVFDRNALGAFGGAATADEIDRMDFKYGSPRNVVVLGSPTGHSDRFGLFLKDRPNGPHSNWNDIPYEAGRGDAVFSVGSVNWYSAPSWNEYKNDIAQIAGNVLRKFLQGLKDPGQQGITKLSQLTTRNYPT
ncbi:hypothetical protein AC579_3948 [Pseudocercospora musae]|uniref:Uncharacterized protein n=1 Tax=Pseudocercospora musae TaxID=113226 RepID=A0A139IKX1_9PEZI|nr:hypothetical protein AC579_3948 [Pseudocercospora musae]